MTDIGSNDSVMQQHYENMEILRQIPGVFRVGFGLKEVRQEPTPEWAYRVYVQRKRPTSELTEEETVPPEIGGYKTDVLVGLPGDTLPSSKTPSLTPGVMITRYAPSTAFDSGTLGLLVRKDSARFILTNDHVITDQIMLSDVSRDVYSPRKKEFAELALNKPVATIGTPNGVREFRKINEGNFFYIDATIVPLREGVKAVNKVEGIGDLDQGLRDLAANVTSPPEMVRVSKRGAQTKLTEGTVVELFRTRDASDPPDVTRVWELSIKPDPVHSWRYDNKVELALDQDIPKIVAFFTNESVSAQLREESGKKFLHLSGHVFSLPGDSGSCVVDNNRRIVGLHYGGRRIRARTIVNGTIQMEELPNGRGVASFIRPVFQAMGLDEATGVIPPAGGSAGMSVAPAEVAHVSSTRDGIALEDLEQTLTRTAAGRGLSDLLTRHGAQIAHLVHHRRRVLVAWHRAQGPGFEAAFLRAVGEPGGRLPSQVGGVRLVEALARMGDVLLQEGDEDLRQAIRDHGSHLLALAERAASLQDLAAALAEADPPCSPS